MIMKAELSFSIDKNKEIIDLCGFDALLQHNAKYKERKIYDYETIQVLEKV